MGSASQATGRRVRARRGRRKMAQGDFRNQGAVQNAGRLSSEVHLYEIARAGRAATADARWSAEIPMSRARDDALLSAKSRPGIFFPTGFSFLEPVQFSCG